MKGGDVILRVEEGEEELASVPEVGRWSFGGSIPSKPDLDVSSR